MNTFTLKLLAAIAIGGVLHRAGSIVDLPEREATDLLRRGKAEPAESAPVELDAESVVGDQDPENPEGDLNPENPDGGKGDQDPENPEGRKPDDPAEKPGKKAKS